jgi:hypothetical protein
LRVPLQFGGAPSRPLGFKEHAQNGLAAAAWACVFLSNSVARLRGLWAFEASLFEGFQDSICSGWKLSIQPSEPRDSSGAEI